MEAYDIGVLMDVVIEKLKSAIQATPYSLRNTVSYNPVDNEWTAIETALIEIHQIAHEKSGVAQKVQALFEEYYRKYLEGILKRIVEE